MQESATKTKPWQRVVIMIVAILLLGSTIAVYAFMVLGNDSGSPKSSKNMESIMAEYEAKSTELQNITTELSGKYFKSMEGYLDDVKSYNSNTANSEGLKIKDLKKGDGRTLGENDADYMAYYIGWCADGEIFDSSFDDVEDPTALSAPLDVASYQDSTGQIMLVEGWNQGVIDMKLGGVREVTMSGELGYGDEESAPCGANSPLRFIIMALAADEEFVRVNGELNVISNELQAAYSSSEAVEF